MLSVREEVPVTVPADVPLPALNLTSLNVVAVTERAGEGFNFLVATLSYG
jgi:hypothetical protein